MTRQSLTVQQRQQRRLNKLAKKYGFEWIPSTERLAELPEELWDWAEERLTQFANLQEALRCLN